MSPGSLYLFWKLAATNDYSWRIFWYAYFGLNLPTVRRVAPTIHAAILMSYI